jgi:hypothetical protein
VVQVFGRWVLSTGEQIAQRWGADQDSAARWLFGEVYELKSAAESDTSYCYFAIFNGLGGVRHLLVKFERLLLLVDKSIGEITPQSTDINARLQKLQDMVEFVEQRMREWRAADAALRQQQQTGMQPANKSPASCVFASGWESTIKMHVLALAKLLQEEGAEICSYWPGPFCCNNPLCTNLAGVSEGFALVRGKSCVCGGCCWSGSRLGVAAAAAAAAGQRVLPAACGPVAAR